MFDIKIYDKKFELPESWDEVTIYNYSQYLQVLDRTHEHDEERTIEIIASVSGQPDLEIELRQLTVEELNMLAEEFKFLLENPNYDNVNKDYITVDEQCYKIKKDFDRFVVDEFVFFKELLGNNEHIHPFIIALGTLLRKVDEQGVESELELEGFWEVVNKVSKKMTLQSIYAYIAFFLPGTKSLSKHGQSTSVEKKVFQIIKKKSTQSKSKKKVEK